MFENKKKPLVVVVVVVVYSYTVMLRFCLIQYVLFLFMHRLVATAKTRYISGFMHRGRRCNS